MLIQVKVARNRGSKRFDKFLKSIKLVSSAGGLFHALVDSAKKEKKSLRCLHVLVSPELNFRERMSFVFRLAYMSYSQLILMPPFCYLKECF